MRDASYLLLMRCLAFIVLCLAHPETELRKVICVELAPATFTAGYASFVWIVAMRQTIRLRLISALKATLN